MTDLWQYLKSTSTPIYLYGMGNGAEKIIDTLDALGIRASGVFASDGFVRNKTFRGFKLKSYSDVKAECPSFIVLVAFGTRLCDVIQNILRISRENELYAPDLPVFGGGLFDLDYCKNNRERIKNIYSLLEDDISKHTFECLVRYKITGNITYLLKCESDHESVYPELIKPHKNEVFIDLGAYRGDTVSEFLSYAQDPASVIAVEPDNKTFNKLVKAVPGFVKCINAAAGENDGFAFFDMQSGRGSHISQNGVSVPALSVDSMLCGALETIIKMDVEGAEQKAINGAKHTISTFRPRLNIAAYHRAYDLLDIPEQVLSIRPDYKVYLRHFPYIPAWDTNYYFI